LLPQLPVELIANARQVIVSDLASNGFVSSSTAESPSAPLYIRSPPSISPKLLDRNDLQRHPTILAAVESSHLRAIMSSLLGAPSSPKVKTHPYKWLRAVGPGLFTGPHVDSTYFPSKQYPSLLTAWIPMVPTTPSLGSLMIAPDLKSVPIELEKGSDGTKAGWIKDSEQEFATARWLSADMSLGDVVVIDPTRCVHMSSRNVEVPEQWRISCDTRWWV
jgi:ectoine hydroxylase-related dioxygenase (phytanoyl-CoA dioxygenase family)